jgi:hypothetical protein
MGSSIVSLQKSEPSLEDVFVELVGRGFEESDEATGDPDAGIRRAPTVAEEPHGTEPPAPGEDRA